MITKTNKLKLTTMTRTMLLMLLKRPSKASRNFAKPVSYKDITEAMQKLFSPLKAQRDNTVKYCATRQY